MKTNLTSLLLAVAVVAVTGCNAPTSTTPVGKTPAKLDPAEWNGRWRMGDGEIHFVRVVDSDAGLAEVDEVEDGKDGLQLTVSQVLVRKEGDALLFNLVSEPDPKDQAANPRHSYIFGRMVRHQDTIVAWPCRKEALEDLTRQGVISVAVTNRGKPDEEQLLTGGFDALARLLAAPEGWLMLKMDEPITMMRERSSP